MGRVNLKKVATKINPQENIDFVFYLGYNIKNSKRKVS